jgi:hypothetical protein
VHCDITVNISMTAKMVGAGSFGCVITPPVHCPKVPSKSGTQYVGKLYNEYHKSVMLTELEFAKRLQAVDPTGMYSVHVLGSCEIPSEFVASLQRRGVCGSSVALQYQSVSAFAGMDLVQVSNVLNTDQLVMTVFSNLSHLISGLEMFNGNDIYHYDIKCANIVMDEATMVCRFIDWGQFASSHIFTTDLQLPTDYLPMDIPLFMWLHDVMYNKHLTGEDFVEARDDALQRLNLQMHETLLVWGEMFDSEDSRDLISIIPTQDMVMRANIANIQYFVNTFIADADGAQSTAMFHKAANVDVFMLGHAFLELSCLVLAKHGPLLREHTRQFIASFVCMVAQPMMNLQVELRPSPAIAHAYFNRWMQTVAMRSTMTAVGRIGSGLSTGAGGAIVSTSVTAVTAAGATNKTEPQLWLARHKEHSKKRSLWRPPTDGEGEEGDNDDDYSDNADSGGGAGRAHAESGGEGDVDDDDAYEDDKKRFQKRCRSDENMYEECDVYFHRRF